MTGVSSPANESTAGIAAAKAVRRGASALGRDSASHQPNAARTASARASVGQAMERLLAEVEADAGDETLISGASSIAIRASATSWNRVFRSLSRQRLRTRRADVGVSGGSADQSTSARSTAASVSE